MRAIYANADKKFDRWKLLYDRKQSGEVILLHKKEVLAEAPNAEYQREREFDDQLADLCAMMKHMSSTFDTKSPKNGVVVVLMEAKARVKVGAKVGVQGKVPSPAEAETRAEVP